MGTVDDYLADLDPADAAVISHVYAVARQAVPDAEQGIGYGMPALTYRGKALLSVMRAKNLDEALAMGRNCEYGNGACIFTSSGYAARQFKRHFNAGMIGINVGVPAPMAWFPFTGWNKSFFGDLHIQGMEGVQFYTQQKMTLTRWFESAAESTHDPVWKGK